MLTLKKAGLQGAVDTDVWYVPMATGGDFVAYTTTTQFAGTGAAMTAGQLFVFSATTDCWIAQGANPTAAKAAGSMFVAKGIQVLIDGAQGAKLAVLQDAAAGNASLTRIDV